uniref:Uncharacterized protein n=1 Tax=Eptatretus burgeri TaxID=7764 RepID=A0A8C4N923_EPTBU
MKLEHRKEELWRRRRRVMTAPSSYPRSMLSERSASGASSRLVLADRLSSCTTDVAALAKVVLRASRSAEVGPCRLSVSVCVLWFREPAHWNLPLGIQKHKTSKQHAQSAGTRDQRKA